MKLKHAFQRGVASALIAGVVLMAGVPALAAGTPGSAQSAAATQSIEDDDTPLSSKGSAPVVVELIEDDDTPLSIDDDETPLMGDEEVPLSNLPDTALVRILRQLLKLLGWKH